MSLVLSPPVEEFTWPVYDHVHQEQIFAGEMDGESGGNPCCAQEQVIVQAIPEFV